jgi:hypothetical protein
MRHEAHPVLMVDAFVKQAMAVQRPAGMSDVRRGQASVGKERQQYAQPNPPAATTRPDMIANQKALSPPPV